MFLSLQLGFFYNWDLHVQKQCGVIDTAESGSAVSMTLQRQKKNIIFSFIFPFNIEKISWNIRHSVFRDSNSFGPKIRGLQKLCVDDDGFESILNDF